jgi:hypothetical protein
VHNIVKPFILQRTIFAPPPVPQRADVIHGALIISHFMSPIHRLEPR